MEDMENKSGKPRSPVAKRLRLVVGFLVIIAAVVVLIARANRSNMVYYVTVSELLAKGQDADSRGLRVTGKVVPGTIERQEMNLRFQMTDGQHAIPISYRGVVPDTFGEDGEVVVEGKYSPGGSFEASFLMAKCPSKYESAPGQPAGKHPEGIPKTS
jgi:cytochrome c-type biogenesis protein CcmE